MGRRYQNPRKKLIKEASEPVRRTPSQYYEGTALHMISVNLGKLGYQGLAARSNVVVRQLIGTSYMQNLLDINGQGNYALCLGQASHDEVCSCLERIHPMAIFNCYCEDYCQ